MAKKQNPPVVDVYDNGSSWIQDNNEVPTQADPEDIDQKTLKHIMDMYWRFRRAETSVQHKHNMWKLLDTFDRGEQWSQSGSIPPWVPKPVTNYLRYVRTTKRANLASGISRPQLLAEHPEDEDTVWLLQMAHDHVWDKNRVDREIRRCLDRALIQGTAIAYVYTDENLIDGKFYKVGDPRNQLFQGDIRVKRWANANFFPDPDAYRIEDCKWIDTTEIVSVNRVKNNPAFRKFCEKNGNLQKLEAINYSQIEQDNDASGTIYVRDNTPLDNMTNLRGDEMVTLHCHWERKFHDGDWHLSVTYYLRNTDFYLLRIEDMQPNEYPFAILYDEEEENDIFGTSTLMDLIENQKIVNKVQQVASIIGTLHQNPQKVVSRESGINAQDLARRGTQPGMVWQANGDPSQAIHILEPPQIPPGLFELDDRTQANIDKISGLNEAYTGQNVGSLTTSTGVNGLIERATVRDKDKLIQVDAFVERISHLITLYILHRWTDKRPIMRKDNEGNPQYQTWDPKAMDIDPKNISWRVHSDIYATSPVTESTRRQAAQTLLQYQGQYQFNPPVITVQEFMRMSNFPDTVQILNRMKQDQVQLDQQKSQNLAQQIMQVAEQIRQASRQGLPPDQVQQMALQMAQQLTQQSQQQELQNGISSPQGNAPKAPQAPQGTTGSIAMGNMTQGS